MWILNSLPLTDFVEKLQLKGLPLQEQIILEVAPANANDIHKKIILGLPF